MKVLWFVLRNLGEYRRLFIVVSLATIVNSLAGFYIPVSLSNFANHPLTTVGQTIILVVGLYGLALLASYIVRGRGEALARKYGNHIRLKYFQELSGLPVEQLRKKHSGYVQSLVNKVADGLVEIIYSMFWDLLPGLLLVVLFFIYVALQSAVLALFNLAIMALFIVASSLLARNMVPISAEQNRRNAALLGGFADFMANITTVVQLGVRPYARGVLGTRAVASNLKIDEAQRFHARRWFALHTLFGMAYMLTIAFLVWQIALGQAQAGLLVLFVAMYGMVRGVIERLSENIKAFMEMRAYLDELEGFIGDLSEGAVRSKRGWKQISLRDVRFNYPDNEETIHVPEFRLAAEQKVCLEGKSGQGKSTFLGLLTDALQPQQGERHVDDEAYEKLGRAFFSSRIAVISQEAELFHLSVRDNLTLGQQVSDDMLHEYIKELELSEWFDSLEKGFDSLVGEKGVTLSAGQRQRVNILRGILLDRSLYILDEPTSHLDTHTEEIVVKFLQKHLAKKAAVIVTHRPALEKICDIKYEMKDHTLRQSQV